MQSDGDDKFACQSKLDWLDPKWHGGSDCAEMPASAQACAATKNWRSGITLLAADAHLRRFHYLPDHAAKIRYMSRPEVWEEIRSVYDEYLKHYPDDDFARSQYAVL